MEKWHYPSESEWGKAQNEHLPTLEYGQQIHDLVKTFTQHDSGPIQALEIGAAWGVSAFAMLMAHPKLRLVSVDKNTCDQTQAEIYSSDYGLRWSFCQMPSAEFWKSVIPDAYDIIYVDGSHLYDDVKNDLDEAWKHLGMGGLLMIDDYDHKKNLKGDPTRENEAEYGVSLAAWEFVREKKIRLVTTTPRILAFIKE
jgi:predicted O-methyltransferase YrrM